MTIIIPMAGLSSRFAKAGFILPKYMLYAGNKSLFNIAVSSFKKYFDDCCFVFVARNIFDTQSFIEAECRQMGIRSYKIVILEHPTRGQAETVAIGLNKSGIPNEESILIFNIDTFRPNFTFPAQIGEWDGFLEVFKGNGTNWSYAKTMNDKDDAPVIETAEKKEISNNCSTGIYYFKTVDSFFYAYNGGSFDINSNVKELYVAPLYNRLIRSGANIHINVISRNEVIFCGIPDEYYDYLKEIIYNDYAKQQNKS